MTFFISLSAFSPVADLVLLLRVKLRSGLAQLWKVKYRVIPETVLAALPRRPY